MENWGKPNQSAALIEIDGHAIASVFLHSAAWEKSWIRNFIDINEVSNKVNWEISFVTWTDRCNGIQELVLKSEMNEKRNRARVIALIAFTYAGQWNHIMELYFEFIFLSAFPIDLTFQQSY